MIACMHEFLGLSSINTDMLNIGLLVACCSALSCKGAGRGCVPGVQGFCVQPSERPPGQALSPHSRAH